MQNDYGGFGFLQYDNYERLIIYDGLWSKELESQIKKRNASHIEIKKWQDDKPLDFIIKFSDQIVDLRLKATLKEISFIEKLAKLKRLSIRNDYVDFIDFSKLRKLKSCLIVGKNIGNIDQCNSLEELSLEKVEVEDLMKIKRLVLLKSLVLSEIKIKTLKGIENLKHLKYLMLDTLPIDSIHEVDCLSEINELYLQYLQKLRDITHISSLSSINCLCIRNCKQIKNLDPIRKLKNLTRLVLDNMKIESLSFLNNLGELERIELYGNTNVLDGDLTPLMNLPKLGCVDFENRKHYTHKHKEIESHIEMKSNS